VLFSGFLGVLLPVRGVFLARPFFSFSNLHRPKDCVELPHVYPGGTLVGERTDPSGVVSRNHPKGGEASEAF
jgi:hypothetical protein